MHGRCVAVLGAVALAVAGCGGGGDADQPASDGAESGPLTRAQVVARGDAICREVKQAQQPYFDRIGALSRGTELKRSAPILEGVLGETRKGRERLAALRAQAPSADHAALDAYLAAADRLLAASERLAEAAKAGDRAEGRSAAAKADSLSADEKRLADAYGFEDCGDVF